jgi:hypothetical protein
VHHKLQGLSRLGTVRIVSARGYLTEDYSNAILDSRLTLEAVNENVE